MRCTSCGHMACVYEHVARARWGCCLYAQHSEPWGAVRRGGGKGGAVCIVPCQLAACGLADWACCAAVHSSYMLVCVPCSALTAASGYQRPKPHLSKCALYLVLWRMQCHSSCHPPAGAMRASCQADARRCSAVCSCADSARGASADM